MGKVKKKLGKNKKQKLTQALAIFLVVATVLGTVAGYGIQLFNNGASEEGHVHYHDADGNTVHLEDIIQNPSSDMYYTDDGREITVDQIIEENGIQFYDPEGNPVDFHEHDDNDSTIEIDLGNTEGTNNIE